ncbi:MAG: hypothetical protein MI923_23725 [Phycisphaerales bacterium]|nr:hypothetical protein [Phycisphaerales bacterium]
MDNSLQRDVHQSTGVGKRSDPHRVLIVMNRWYAAPGGYGSVCPFRASARNSTHT